ncbi:MAG: ester cyclase [Geminicoccaceae bacterium]
MSELERNKALVRAHYDATVNHFDPAAIDRQVAIDFFDHAAGATLGPEGVCKHIQSLLAAIPDLRATIDDIIAEGDRVAVRATWCGTHAGPFRGLAPSHKRFTATGMVFWRIRDGLLVERWAAVDLLGALEQAAR